MSKSSRQSEFFIYVRDNQNRHLGITIAIINRQGFMFHGESHCSAKDQFCKKIGRKIALERAVAEATKYFAKCTTAGYLD